MRRSIRQRNFGLSVVHSWRQLGVVLCVAACLFAVGCAKKNGTSDELDTRATLGAPPQEGEQFFKPKGVPSGPKVIEGFQESRIPAEQNIQAPVESRVTPVKENAADTQGKETIARKDLDSFLKHGPRHILKVVGVQPSFRSGRFVGYQVTGFAPEVRETIGRKLQKGDVIVKVNNRSIARPEDYMAAWESMKNCVELRVQLVRSGEKVDLKWPVY